MGGERGGQGNGTEGSTSHMQFPYSTFLSDTFDMQRPQFIWQWDDVYSFKAIGTAPVDPPPSFYCPCPAHLVTTLWVSRNAPCHDKYLHIFQFSLSVSRSANLLMPLKCPIIGSVAHRLTISLFWIFGSLDLLHHNRNWKQSLSLSLSLSLSVSVSLDIISVLCQLSSRQVKSLPAVAVRHLPYWFMPHDFPLWHAKLFIVCSRCCCCCCERAINLFV